MASRETHPIRRSVREEARVWPIAIALVVVYLLIAHWLDQSATDRVDSWTVDGAP